MAKTAIKKIPAATLLQRQFLTQLDFSSKYSELQNYAFRAVQFKAAHEEHEEKTWLTHVTIPALSNLRYEVWTSGQAPSRSIKGGMSIARYGGLSLYSIHAPGDDLKKSAVQAYKKLFHEIQKNPQERLLRAWNYIPNILDANGDLERYHEFNRGRFEAWQKYGPKDAEGRPIYPAATGIGSHGGPVVIECLTTVYDVQHLQNPRQTPAHLYSKKYGSLPPVFARATLHIAPDGVELYISGTASIVGEDAIHLDDPLQQAKETLLNIAALIGRENLKGTGHAGFELKDLEVVRVYVKHPKDLAIIRREVEKSIPSEHIIYLHDDICRKEWLLEIEAVARKR